MAASSSSAVAWQPLVISGHTYIVKPWFSDNGYEVFLSDFSRIWSGRAEDDDVIALCQTVNPSLEAPLESILLQLKTLFMEPEKVQAEFSIDKKERFCELSTSSRLVGYIFNWKFFMDRMTGDEMGKQVTLPLMMMTSELRRQNEELIKIIKNKDSEIENYRLQGYKVTRKNLETVKFDEEKFHKDTLTSITFVEEAERLGSGALSRFNQDLYHDLMLKSNLIHTEPQSITEAWTSERPVKKSPAKPKPAPPQKTESETTAKETELARKRALEAKLDKEKRKLEEGKKKKRKLKL